MLALSILLTSCAGGTKKAAVETPLPSDALVTSTATPESTPTPAPTATPEPTPTATPDPVVEIPYIFTLDEEGWREYGIPTSFDLRSVDTDGDGKGDRCFVTSVKLQNPYGTCWGFSAIAASEISILGSIYLNDPEAYKKLDLSEKQFTYFMNLPLDDEENPQNGEGFYPPDKSNDYLFNTGGNSCLALSLFAQGVGLSEEYKEGNEVFIYRGANGYTEQRIIDGEFRNFCYSSDDDWSIPEDYRFKFDYTLRTAILLAEPAKHEAIEGDKDGKTEYVYNAEATEAIKLQLLQRRGVSIACCADNASPDEEDNKPGKYLNTDTWAHYTWDDGEVNHAVTIIGWDDDYAKENFLADHQPPENGAWLVKNSWGSGEEEFPNKGDGQWGIKVPLKDKDGNEVKDENGETVMTCSGYFWLSYYDMSLALPTAFILEKNDSANEYTVDQHNYFPLFYITYEDSEEESRMANVFKASKPQMLDSFSFIAPADRLTVKYSVYILRSAYENPEDGMLIFEGEGFYEHQGYYKIQLDNQTYIQQGQFFSVIVTMTDEDGLYYRNYICDYSSKGSETSFAVVNKGESYYYEDGWHDYVEYRDKKVAEEEDLYSGWTCFIDNFPIKALSYPLTEKMNIKLVDISDHAGVLYLYEGEDKTTVKLRFYGDGDREMGIPEIKWGIIGDDGIVSIREKKNGGELEITGLKEGTVYLTASVEGIGTTVGKFEVMKYEISKISVEDAVFDGSKAEPEVKVYLNSDKLLTEGTDYTVSYFNNNSCGIGKVVVTPIGKDLGDGVSNVLYFKIAPPAPEIKSISIKNGKIKGTLSDMSKYGTCGYVLVYAVKGTYDYTYEWVDVPAFELSVDDGYEYEVSVCCGVNVTGQEMDEEMAENTYDEDVGFNIVYSQYSNSVTVTPGQA